MQVIRQGVRILKHDVIELEIALVGEARGFGAVLILYRIAHNALAPTDPGSIIAIDTANAIAKVLRLQAQHQAKG